MLFDAIVLRDPLYRGCERFAQHQKPDNGAAFGTKATVAAWHARPTYYAISANDLMPPVQAEGYFAHRMNATVVTLQSSHASPVSHPTEVAALIERAATSR